MVRGSVLTEACSNLSDLDFRLESAFTADSTWLPPLSSGIQDEHQEWRPEKSGGVGGPRAPPARGIAHIPDFSAGHLHGEPSPASCHRRLATGELRAARLSRAEKSSWVRPRPSGASQGCQPRGTVARLHAREREAIRVALRRWKCSDERCHVRLCATKPPSRSNHPSVHPSTTTDHHDPMEPLRQFLLDTITPDRASIAWQQLAPSCAARASFIEARIHGMHARASTRPQTFMRFCMRSSREPRSSQCGRLA